MKLRPLVIPVFIPHAGCPHRCIFCDQAAITQTQKKPSIGAELISQAIETYQPHGRNPDRLTEIAFFGGNFLGLQQENIVELLTAATKWIDQGRVDSIRFSTRPDTIDDQRLDIIAPFSVKTIEIGAQSMDDRVLAATQRGHSVEDIVRAIKHLKQHQYQAGIQLMVGLPGENEQTTGINSTTVCGLAPDFVRIYPTLVLAGSPLSKAYRSGQYQPLALDLAVEKCAIMVAQFLSKGIAVIRIGLPADVAADPEQLLAGPFHPAFGHLVYERLYFLAAENLFHQSSFSKTATLRVHPKGISTLRGLNNGSTTQLTELFCLEHLEIIPDDTLERYQVALGDQCRSILDIA